MAAFLPSDLSQQRRAAIPLKSYRLKDRPSWQEAAGDPR